MSALQEHSYTIFCDSLQEGVWFKNLNTYFADAELRIMPHSQREQREYGIEHILQYDRPDIILMDGRSVIFVLERTVEVPSGHNVGQRFGRLVAAAKERISVVYFGPYMAYKHGGDTAGPRYMNLRLFYALKNMAEQFNTAVTTINWPVDQSCEVLRTPLKDRRVVKYLDLFMGYYHVHGIAGLTEYIKNSSFQQEQYLEQKTFAEREVRNPEQYDIPPDSVEIMPVAQFESTYSALPHRGDSVHHVALYRVGMTAIRSDPYAGMAALYHYLYGGNGVVQILHFPNIRYATWCALGRTTKTFRMFKEFSYAILFQDQLVMSADL